MRLMSFSLEVETVIDYRENAHIITHLLNECWYTLGISKAHCERLRKVHLQEVVVSVIRYIQA